MLHYAAPQAIYPEMHYADDGLSAALGPDAKGRGLHWAVPLASGGEIIIICYY